MWHDTKEENDLCILSRTFKHSGYAQIELYDV